MLDTHKTGSEIIPPWRPERLFPNVAQYPEEVSVKWRLKQLKVAQPKLLIN